MVLDHRVLRDVAQIRADEGQLVRAIHPLDLVEAVDGLLVQEVAPQPVDRVGRVPDDLAGLERFDGAADFPRLRVLGVNR